MGRFFLSGQTTCALLLGAGLLLRAQAALRSEPEQQAAAQTAETAPGTRNSDMVHNRGAKPMRVSHPTAATPKVIRADQPQARSENPVSQSGKILVHRSQHSKRRCGVALAARGFRCG